MGAAGGCFRAVIVAASAGAMAPATLVALIGWSAGYASFSAWVLCH